MEPLITKPKFFFFMMTKRIVTQSCQGIYIYKVYILAISQQRKTHFYHALRPLLFTFNQFNYFLKLVPSLEFQKKFAVFHFLSAISEKQESTIIESLKFKVSSYGILKIQKTISLAKVSLKKQFNLIDVSCCDKYN